MNIEIYEVFIRKNINKILHCCTWRQRNSEPQRLSSLNGWAFVYKLSGCGFESCCCDLNFRYGACFEQGVPWHSGNYRVQNHSEICMWQDNNIQSDWCTWFTLLL